jgi:hypothetical protein
MANSLYSVVKGLRETGAGSVGTEEGGTRAGRDVQHHLQVNIDCVNPNVKVRIKT